MKSIITVLAGVIIIAATMQETTAADQHAHPVRVAVLTGEGFHDGEAYMPIGFLSNRGVEVTVIGVTPGVVNAYNSAFTILIERAVTDVEVEYFDALILPGGQAPAALREHKEVVDFVRAFYNAGKPVAAICHGPQILVRAGVMQGVRATAVGGIEEELTESGAMFVDEPVVVHENLITSRTPPDLAAFCHAIAAALE